MIKQALFSLAAGVVVVLAAGNLPTPTLGSGWIISEAHARFGRPLSPLSFAGAARRTTRRVYRRRAIYAPPVYAPAAGCYRAVDAYGRIYHRCP